MLTFTSHQLDSIAAKTLLYALENHWRASFPTRFANADPVQVRQLANGCIAVARERGFSIRNDVIQFADLYLLALKPGRAPGREIR